MNIKKSIKIYEAWKAFQKVTQEAYKTEQAKLVSESDYQKTVADYADSSVEDLKFTNTMCFSDVGKGHVYKRKGDTLSFAPAVGNYVCVLCGEDDFDL